MSETNEAEEPDYRQQLNEMSQMTALYTYLLILQNARATRLALWRKIDGSENKCSLSVR